MGFSYDLKTDDVLIARNSDSDERTTRGKAYVVFNVGHGKSNITFQVENDINEYIYPTDTKFKRRN